MRFAKVAMSCRSRYTLYVSVYLKKAQVKAIYLLFFIFILWDTFNMQAKHNVSEDDLSPATNTRFGNFQNAGVMSN